MLSNRVRKFVTHWDFIGSRIVYCRLKGHTCNYFVIGIYIPQSKRINPDQSNTYDELATLLNKVSNRDCIILLGDFNSRLARDIDNHTGHWSIHNRNDDGGDRLLEIMQAFAQMCQYLFSTSSQTQQRNISECAATTSSKPDQSHNCKLTLVNICERMQIYVGPVNESAWEKV